MTRQHRPLPYSPDAEKNVLGSAVIWPENADLLTRELVPSDFFDPFHADMAGAIQARVSKGERVTDQVVIVDLRLDDPGMEDKRQRLAEMLRECAPPVRPSINEIWDCALRRRVLLAAGDLARVARDRGTAMDEVLDAARHVADVAEVQTTNAYPDPDLDDFLDQDEAYDWLVPGLIERRDRVMITGEEGRGKARFSASSPSASRPASVPSAWVPRSRCA